MTYSQQQFLYQFDQPIRNYIIEYCKKISEKNYDVYLLMARKAACFMSVLESLGFVSLNGVVVSDRVQEFNPDWLKGKRIAIIDDTIISGTTINKLIGKLESFGVAEIAVHTFCIDSYWYRDDMLEHDKHEYLVQPYMKMEHSSCIRFCRQIVNALSVIPRPYNIDFPTYEIHKLTRLNYHNVLSDVNWKIVNTTTLLQSQNEVDSVSLNFNRDMLDRFFAWVGVDFRNAMFLKVRLFSKKLMDNKNPKSFRYSVRVVPYAIFNKMEASMADNIVSAICCSEGKDKSLLDEELVTDCSKMIFIQYYFSERLMKWWASYTEKLLGKNLEATINKRSLSLLFSPSVIEIISDFKHEKPVVLDRITLSVVNRNPEIKYALDEQGINPFEVRDCLTQVFLDMYYEKELPARRLALKHGKDMFVDESKDYYIHRLECGVSLVDLKKRVAKHVNNSTDANLILSTFLDNAIDAGIAVPITISDKGVLYRGFRHGEEVVWGDANDKMLAVFFERIFGKNGIVPKLQFEKMLSLFVKLGLKRGLLTDYNFALPDNKKVRIIGVRSYLYGQVTVNYEILPGQKIAYNPVLDSEDTGQWTTTRFKDFGLIKENTFSGYELHFENMPYMQYERFKEANEAGDLDRHIMNDIQNMADVFKMCYDNKLLNDDKLVWLTSCLSLLDNTSSLNAEIVLFRNGVDSYLNRIKTALIGNQLTVDFLKSLRHRKKQKIWTAVNSGRIKYKDYKQDKGKLLIKEIENELVNLSGFASREWWQFWSQELQQKEECDDDLNELNNKSGRILIDVLNVMTCLHVLLYECLLRDGKSQEWEDRINWQISAKESEKRKAIINLSEGDLTEEATNTIKKLEKEIASLKKQAKQWSNYVVDSCNLIESGLSVISKEESKSMRYASLYQIIKNGQYRNLSNDDLFDLIYMTLAILEIMKTDADAIYQEYKLVVPLWGKMENFAQYISLIHIRQLTVPADEISLDSIVDKIILDVELEEYQGTRNKKSLTVLHTKEEIFRPQNGIVIGGKGERHVERMVKIAGRLLLYCKEKGISVSISFFPDYNENGIRAYYNEQTGNADLLKKEIYSQLPINNDGFCINVYSEKQQTEYFYYNILRQNAFRGRLKAEEAHGENDKLKFKIVEHPLTKKIFISYSRCDIEYKKLLVKHLNMLNLYRIVDTWSCEDLREDNWNEEVQKELDESNVVIYMLSVDFFLSPYIIEHEVCNVMQNKGHRKVLCVLVNEFADLDRIKEYIQNKIGVVDDKSRSVLELSKFQYLPYGMVHNKIRDVDEEKLIPLANYKNKTGNQIDTAYKSIAERVLKLLETMK